jgi:hypothetical protein
VSGEKNPAPRKGFFLEHSGQKEKILCGVWIASILLAGILVFAISAGFRERILSAAINKVLEESGVSWRVENSNPSRGLRWYKNSGETRVCVFTVITANGSGLYAAALDRGLVTELAPLSAGAREQDLAPAVRDFYVRRVEKAAGGLP